MTTLMNVTDPRINTPEWREFEKLVARVEHALAPADMIIRSPDHVEDKVTGGQREVDASIRPKSGGKPIRVLECRDRSKAQDVTWIEQIATKCADHGIPTTAVSANGFTGPAMTKAVHYGIETRTTSEVSQDAMIGWIKVHSVDHVIYHAHVSDVRFVLRIGPNENPQIHPTVTLELNADAGRARVLKDKDSGDCVSACVLLDRLRKKHTEPMAGVPETGEKITRTLQIALPDFRYTMLTTAGDREVSRIRIIFEAFVETIHVPMPNEGIRYDGSIRPAVQGVEATASVLGETVLTSFYRQAGSNEFVIVLSKSDGISPITAL